jgi:hypothetical protein
MIMLCSTCEQDAHMMMMRINIAERLIKEECDVAIDHIIPTKDNEILCLYDVYDVPYELMGA